MLTDIDRVDFLPEKREGCRFDIVTQDRTYAMDTSTVRLAKLWARDIRAAVNAKRKTMSSDAYTPSKPVIPGLEWTKLQQYFFCLVFGARNLAGSGPSDVRSMELDLSKPIPAGAIFQLPQIGISQEFLDSMQSSNRYFSIDDLDIMRRDFKTDALVLRYILVNVIGPIMAEAEQIEYEYRKIGVSDIKDQSLIDSGVIDELKQHLYTPDEFIQLSVADRVKRINLTESLELKRLRAKMNAGDPQLQSRGDDVDIRVKDGIVCREFVRVMLEVFSREDEEAHDLAVTVLWFLCPDHFAQYIKIYCCGENFSHAIRDALFTILLNNPHEVVPKILESQRYTLYANVVQYQVWESIFACITGTDWTLREEVLADINTLLINNEYNCEKLMDDKEWQTYLFPLFCDIPKEHKHEDPYKKSYSYTLNVLVLPHFEYLFHKPDLTLVLFETFDHLRIWGGQSDESQNIAFILIRALINKLPSARNRFSHDQYDTATEWRNFAQLIETAKQFVFQSAQWATETDYLKQKHHSSSPVKKDEEEPLNRAEKFALLERQHSANKSNPSLLRLHSMQSDHKLAADVGQKHVLWQARNMSESQFRTFGSRISHYGFHFDSVTGECCDIDLIQKVGAVFSALYIADVTPGSMGQLSRGAKVFLKWAKSECRFWNDAAMFAQSTHRQHIEKSSAYTYRKLAVTTKAFLQARSTVERQGVVDALSSKLQAPRLDAALLEELARRRELAHQQSITEAEDESLLENPDGVDYKHDDSGNESEDEDAIMERIVAKAAALRQQLESSSRSDLVMEMGNLSSTEEDELAEFRTRLAPAPSVGSRSARSGAARY
jgi:Neurobeachin/BDCP, DUF4704 alpha solenoid region